MIKYEIHFFFYKRHLQNGNPQISKKEIPIEVFRLEPKGGDLVRKQSANFCILKFIRL